MKFVFIHGYMSNPEADWYPKITEELTKLGHEVSIPAMPGHRRPNPKEWVEVVTREAGSGDVFLVGHSLGTRAILSYLEQSQNTVKGVLLISPPNGMWHNRVEKKDIGNNKITILHSKDDKIVAFDQAEQLAQQLAAKFIAVDGHGHFTKPEDAELVKSTLLDLLPA